MNRDVSIQRFEYTCEAVWKAAQLYLRKIENLESLALVCNTRVFYFCSFERGAGEDRTRNGPGSQPHRAHYNEELANQIYARLTAYADLMAQWLQAMQVR